jgi:hypothetical protein
MLDGRPHTYQQWAETYFEKPVNLSAVIHIYEHRPLTGPVVAALNPSLSIQDLAFDLAEIDYGA